MRLPQGVDPDNATVGYVTALQGFNIGAIEAGIQRFLRGECEDVSPKFCPYPPELARICRTTVYAPMERHEPRGYVSAAPRVPLMERVERKRREYANRPVLFTNHTLDMALRLSRSGQLPVGAQWVPMLGGNIYGPERA